MNGDHKDNGEGWMPGNGRLGCGGNSAGCDGGGRQKVRFNMARDGGESVDGGGK